MIRILAILLAVSVAGNAVLAWWGLHEYGRAETAVSAAMASVSAAHASAEASARAQQQIADRAAMDELRTRLQHAQAVATAAQLQVSTATTRAADTVRQLHEVNSHAKPTDCARQPLPSDVRRVLSGAESSAR